VSVDTLREPRSIAIIGGGPAGALTALHLLQLAREKRRHLEVTVFDRKEFGVTGPRGCNMCAGVVSNSLIVRLERLGVHIPPSAVQRTVDAYCIHSGGRVVRLEKPPGSRIYTAFRSGGPMGEEFGTARSFDHALLAAAVDGGARHIRRVVTGIERPARARDPVVLTDAEGARYRVDAVVGAFGVNSRMVLTFRGLGFGYSPPRTAMAAQCEVPLAPADIDRLFGNDVHVLAGDLEGVIVAAMVPKERHVTVSLIGPWVGQAHLERFMQRPEVLRLLPEGYRMPERYCHCHPLLPITGARNVVADRTLVVGDAHISRYLKNGLDSAFTTAEAAARAIVEGGVGRDALVEQYVRPCRRAFVWDNRCGRVLFSAYRTLGRRPRLTRRICVAAQDASGSPTPLRSIAWGLLTGDEPYAALLRQALSPRLHWHLAVGAARGLRAKDTGAADGTEGGPS